MPRKSQSRSPSAPPAPPAPSAPPALDRPITKSDFKLGLECIQKLRHKRDGLLGVVPNEDMCRLLSEGGGAAEALAAAIEPAHFVGPDGGAEVGAVCMDAVRSQFALAVRHGGSGSGTAAPRVLREVTIVHDGFLARLDVLRLWLDRIEVVEQKSKSIHASKGTAPLVAGRPADRVAAPWVSYVQDLSFQAVLLQRWIDRNCETLGIPRGIAIAPRLMLMNKEGCATAADCLANFRSTHRIDMHRVRSWVRFEGTAPTSTSLLVEIDGAQGVQLLSRNAQAAESLFGGAGIADCMDQLKRIVGSQAWPAPGSSIGVRCKGCEYRLLGEPDCGFSRCWGSDPQSPDHILRLGRVQDRHFQEATRKAMSADASLTVLDHASLTDGQVRQWEVARSGRQWVSDALRTAPLKTMRAPASGPVAFLDFETLMYPIPARVGGKPFELVPFQAEAVMLPSAGAELRDRVMLPGFLDLASPDPRRAFVRALQAQLGGMVVVYHWTAYECTVLKSVRDSLAEDPAPEPGDPALMAFIDALLAKMVDLAAITKENFLDPLMAGSFSIKRLLPVLWADPAIRAAFAPNAAPGDPDGYVSMDNPYASLEGVGTSFIESVGGDAVIRALDASASDEGGIQSGDTASLFAHYVRIFGGADRADVQGVFRRYCRLDANAMLMAFGYLRGIR